MKTNVFISWSGKLSKQIAQNLKVWLMDVIQQVEPFFSEEDIEKGSLGVSTIMDQLRKSEISIVILTQENIHSEWLLFETGCIKGQGAPACGILFGLRKEELNGPLQQIQQTHFEKEDFFLLMETINKHCKSPMNREQLKRIFDIYWTNLENQIKPILDNYTPDTTEEQRSTHQSNEKHDSKNSPLIKVLYNACKLRGTFYPTELCEACKMDIDYMEPIFMEALSKKLIQFKGDAYKVMMTYGKFSALPITAPEPYQITAKGKKKLQDVGLLTESGLLSIDSN